LSTANASGVLLVTASAGSGKTTRLTRAVTDALDPGNSQAIAVPGLFAVTYTTKAQAELESRLRRALVERRQFTRAEELPLAHVGTVHAVCLRLLQEFALDAGVSPAVDGLPQEAARLLLQQALEYALPPSLRQRVESLASALELNRDHRSSSNDWVTPVEQIMTLARNNRIVPDSLLAMGERSADGLLGLLGPAAADGGALEEQLAQLVDQTLGLLNARDDGQKNTAAVLETLRTSQRELRRQGLSWSGWCRLAKLRPGKQLLPLVSDLQLAAAQYEFHPRFQRQIRDLCIALFEAARLGLDAYAEFKAERGLVDYVDMIDLALSALDVPEVAAELSRRVEMLVVDEFQDTSPLQLALFSKLHGFCRRSLWVGDRKQCIFEYAGADPTLMEAVADWVGRNGGATEVLGKNYRSRPELVLPISHLFASAFAVHGVPRDQVATEPVRLSLPEQAALPAFGVWWLGASRGKEALAIAEGVRRLLEQPAETPVVDRQRGDVRALRAGDVAVLVATNLEAAKIAQALAAQGVHSSLPRTGLMQRPEATLLNAALRYLVDGHDQLAQAEVEALLGFQGLTRDEWFSDWLRYRCARGGDETEKPNAGSRAVELDQLDALRPLVRQLSPFETVQRVFAELRLPELTQRWPEPEQGLGNLDALLTLARAYEDRATYMREAASLAGLLRYFDETRVAIKQQDEERATDEQFVMHSDATVTLVTYHKAKGLEWPVVVLGSLDREARRHAFEVMPETDRGAFDAHDPLGSRWIRYWPWPLGQQKSVPLRDRAESSEVGRRVSRRDGRERVRLLYVGFTRARDHLVLAITTDAKGKPRCAWADELRDAEGRLLRLPAVDAQSDELVVGGTAATMAVPARVWRLGGRAAVVAAPKPDARRWYTPGENKRGVGYRIQPSSAAIPALSTARVVSQECFSRRLPLRVPKGVTWEAVGTALHAFLAADARASAHTERAQLAHRILEGAGLCAAIDPDALVAASDSLGEYIDARWPGATWHREVPIVAHVDSESGERCIRGTIDLLLELPGGVAIIDHKSFPGRVDQWEEHALGYASQLLLYATALQAAGYVVTGQFIHFTVGGGMVEIVQCISDGGRAP